MVGATRNRRKVESCSRACEAREPGTPRRDAISGSPYQIRSLEGMTESACQPSSDILGKVSENYFGAGPVDGQQRLKNSAFPINPAGAGGGLDHREFSAYLVGRQGNVEGLASQRKNVQVGEGRFHHDDVRALFDIERNFAHRFPLIGRVHLVRAAVAELWG